MNIRSEDKKHVEVNIKRLNRKLFHNFEMPQKISPYFNGPHNHCSHFIPPENTGV